MCAAHAKANAPLLGGGTGEALVFTDNPEICDAVARIIDAGSVSRVTVLEGGIAAEIDFNFADLDHDLCGPIKPGSGRHPLPGWDAFCGWLGRQGVKRGSTVVAYDDSHGAYAARLWWMLRTLGHAHVAVLDGGFARWTREGRPVDTAVPQPAPARFEARPHASAFHARRLMR